MLMRKSKTLETLTDNYKKLSLSKKLFLGISAIYLTFQTASFSLGMYGAIINEPKNSIKMNKLVRNNTSLIEKIAWEKSYSLGLTSGSIIKYFMNQ